MKRKDLTLMILVAAIAGLLSVLLSGALFGSIKNNPTKIPVVQPISSSFPVVNEEGQFKTIFHNQAINPTQLIRIGDETNPQPFRGQ